MTIYFDFMGHMVSDESIEELHDFAQGMGLKREWFQNKGNDARWIPHYDLTTARAKMRAKDKGAQQVDPFEVVRILKEAPYAHRRQEYL